MSQHSGFFESRWDETLINPETGQLGDWDIKYFYNQFSEYFSKFFGNGVYYNPTDCLQVIANSGMSVLVKAGWGFIKGFWYELDEDMTLTIPANTTPYQRVDSVMLRWNLTNRTITLAYLTDTVDVTRNDVTYDLKLAEIIVGPGVAEVLGSAITDTRTNQEVCGIVRGLESDAIDTEDLFAQYDAIFNEWFDGIKDQLTGDLGARLQLEFAQLNQNVEDYYEQTTQDIETFKSDVQATVTANTNTINNFVGNYFEIPLQTFTFVNNVCEISDTRITSDSLVDVYFTEASTENAEAAVIYVDSLTGKVRLTATYPPVGTIQGVIAVKRNVTGV